MFNTINKMITMLVYNTIKHIFSAKETDQFNINHAVQFSQFRQ